MHGVCCVDSEGGASSVHDRKSYLFGISEMVNVKLITPRREFKGVSRGADLRGGGKHEINHIQAQIHWVLREADSWGFVTIRIEGRKEMFS